MATVKKLGTKKSDTEEYSKIKRTVKYLSHCDAHPKIFHLVVKAAPDWVVKIICNAALNVAKNPDTALGPQQRKLFGRHRRQISGLIDKGVSLARKRTFLEKSRTAAKLVPAVLRAALRPLGGLLFTGVPRK